jgi:hypothetical protein
MWQKVIKNNHFFGNIGFKGSVTEQGKRKRKEDNKVKAAES